MLGMIGDGEKTVKIAVELDNAFNGQQHNRYELRPEDLLAADREARRQGMDLVGPLSADTMFHAAARSGYDAAVAMYHDQALIPIKTLAFDRGVNVTLGLPFIRTSPDHGTAYGIAGRGEADPTSLIEALRLAEAMARARAGHAAS